MDSSSAGPDTARPEAVEAETAAEQIAAPPAEPERPVDTGERLVPGAHPDSIVEAEHLARYQLAARLAAGRRVLDVGCGLGYGSAMIARAGAQAVSAVDVDEQTIEWARRRYGDAIAFEVGDMLAMPFPERSFDLVVSFEAIEHVPDPERALDEMKRVMTEDGVLIVSSPNRPRYSRGNRFHFRELTGDELLITLKGRFEHVRMLRQCLHLASVIVDDEAIAAAGPELEHPAALRRLAPGSPGDEVFSIAVAGNRRLPEVGEATVMVTEGQSLRHWHDAAAAWRERAFRAEAEAERARGEAAHALFDRDHTREEMLELKLRRRFRR